MWSLDFVCLRNFYEFLLQTRDQYLVYSEQFIEQNTQITNIQKKLETIHETMVFSFIRI
jgi:hypothetical protein